MTETLEESGIKIDKDVIESVGFDPEATKLPKIIKDAQLLKTVCDPVTKEEGEEISKLLFQVLTKEGGAGLAAPQIGINKRVCVVNVKKPLYFINPTYVEKSGELVYVEACLSFPNTYIRTQRYNSILVKCDNMESNLYNDVSHIPSQFWLTDPDVFETVAIQHEMDHLDGVLMFDRAYKQPLLKKSALPERNEKVKITDGKEILEMKFKKAEPMIATGKWNLI